MTTTTMEGNRIIAEFMGNLKYGENGESWYFPENTIPDLGIYIYDEDLQFHTSWDWLMPVMEKIEDLSRFPHGHVSIRYQCTTIGVYTSGGQSVPEFNIQHCHKTKIENTYNAVLEFINRYTTSNRPDGE